MVTVTDPFVALAILATAVGLVGSVVVWYQRDSRGARAYTALLLVLSAWAALYAMELLQTTLDGKRQWLVVRHAISPLVPLSFWVFVARFLDREELLRPRILGPIAVAGIVLAPTAVLNPGGLYLRELGMASVGSLPVLDVTFGPLFWVMLSYIVLVVGVGHSLVVDLLADSFSVYRRQLAAVALSGVVGFGLLALFLTDHVAAIPSLNPAENVQLVSYATVLVTIPLGWSYFRDALFSLQPLANRTVIGNMNDAVFVLDTDGTIRNSNGEARRLIDHPDTDSLTGLQAGTAFADCPTLLDAYESAADEEKKGATHSAEPEEADPIVVDGQRQYFDVRVSTIRNAMDAPIGKVIVARDVTERARQRERLERQNERLERLADVIAHDMRTPVSTGRKTLTLLERGISEPDPMVAQSLDNLGAVVDRLEVFVDQLPQLARESTDVQSTTTCNLRDVATDSWRVVDSDTVTLEVETTRTLQADRSRLQQLLENLFKNSLEYSSTDSSPEAIADGSETAETQQTGDEAAVSLVRVGTTSEGFYVEDDGPGIPPSLREEVFEYGTSGSDGSGFGLAIVRTIVEAHGWAIEVGESPEGGARFEIYTDR